MIGADSEKEKKMTALILESFLKIIFTLPVNLKMIDLEDLLFILEKSRLMNLTSIISMLKK